MFWYTYKLWNNHQIKLFNISITSHGYHFRFGGLLGFFLLFFFLVWLEYLRYTLLANIKYIIQTKLLTIVTFLYIWAPELFIVHNWNFLPLTKISPFPSPSTSWQPPFYTVAMNLTILLQILEGTISSYSS